MTIFEFSGLKCYCESTNACPDGKGQIECTKEDTRQGTAKEEEGKGFLCVKVEVEGKAIGSGCAKNVGQEIKCYVCPNATIDGKSVTECYCNEDLCNESPSPVRCSVFPFLICLWRFVITLF